ncbi:phosphocarrier protein HPr [Saccharospirillum sp. MSK14-1]|uniref:HPr family phosphocarrier protein n=1 Tax=Saccharospirillum sp. MSK14-1 TaxID=1897632 RepID=UPI000D368FA3|nr:HPr family phosphocarrier protein [Saccharospirillum sp. MSK14-1]PTY38885.1 phosphocarrier protein HPr [Saccharospirillum sp. MSK14-1]
MIQEQLTIINKLGLHARAAAKLVGVAGQYESHITLRKDGREADAKSIMSVMMLAASQGSDLTVDIDGPDAAEAWTAILALVQDRFGEAE